MTKSIYAFRVDSSNAIGYGHLMRCLTLATELKKNSIQSYFISANLDFNSRSKIIEMGHESHILPYFKNKAFDLKEDAKETKLMLKRMNIEWLIVDHYAIDIYWESELKGICKHIMVIDDLANRAHHSDIGGITPGSMPAFSKNIADDKSEVYFEPSELAGLSGGELGSLEFKSGKYTVTMSYPDVNAVLENCSVRKSRESVWKAFNNRAVSMNLPILKETVVLRNEKAKLFGFETWSQYRLKYRMAKNPDNVNKMYDSLIPALQKSAEAEKMELSSDNIDPTDISPWDIRYLITKRRNMLSNLDNSELKKYFYIHDVKVEMFSICEEVFDISIKQEDSKTAWHEDVELWSIWNENDIKIAYFYLDLYPRKGKFTHAAVFDISPGSQDGETLPVCSMVTNFPNPNTGDGLMNFDEVETLFHEFGHVLHNGIGKSKFARFLGANVEWDFVEAPSQIMEHWVWKSECLKRFSKNIETGEVFSAELSEKINETKNIGISLLTLRQVSFGLADQHLHGLDFADDLDEVEKNSQKVTTLEYPNDVNHLGCFGHLLGGYDAAYYGYLWADIIGDDLFSRFEKEGVLSKSVGVEYKQKILSVGGSINAEDMVEDFLGRKWNDKAFLDQKKLTKS